MGSAIGSAYQLHRFWARTRPRTGNRAGFLVDLDRAGHLTASSAFLRFHQGYNSIILALPGMIGMIAVAIMRQFKVEIEAVSILGSDHSL